MIKGLEATILSQRTALNSSLRNTMGGDAHFHAFIKHRPYPNPRRAKMAARCLGAGQMEAIRIWAVIRGHGYELFTAPPVPSTFHRHSHWV